MAEGWKGLGALLTVVGCWKNPFAGERLAAARRPCTIHTGKQRGKVGGGPVPVVKEAAPGCGLGQLLKEVTPDLVYMSGAPPPPRLPLAELVPAEAAHRVVIEVVDLTIVVIVPEPSRLRRLRLAVFVMHIWP